MSDKDTVPSNKMQDGEVVRVSLDNAKYLTGIVLQVQLKKMTAVKGIEIIDDRLLAVDKQIALPGGNAFLPLKALCVELRGIITRGMS